MTDRAALLRQADIFYDIPAEYLERVAGLCQEHNYQAGETIFPEGAESDELYIIVQGAVDILVTASLVSRQAEKQEAPGKIATLRRGQSFGEVALVDQGVRSATTCAVEDDTRLLTIPRQGLMALCDAHPELGYRLMRNLAADLAMKLRNTDLLIRQEYLGI